MMVDTAWRVPKYGVFSGPNAGKYGPEKTPYLDTFHALLVTVKLVKKALLLYLLCALAYE